jgi:hypothetical protein
VDYSPVIWFVSSTATMFWRSGYSTLLILWTAAIDQHLILVNGAGRLPGLGNKPFLHRQRRERQQLQLP